MHKYMHQVVKTMDQRQLYEARWMEKPTLYNVMKAFNPHAFLGTMGRHDTSHVTKSGSPVDLPII